MPRRFSSSIEVEGSSEDLAYDTVPTTAVQVAVNQTSQDREEVLRQVAQWFSAEGTLAQHLPYFNPRASQAELAADIASAIIDKKLLYAEAGTGTGKTFAYLIPALLWGGRVIIATATKNLQDQLFLQDLPKLLEITKVNVSRALLKGRGNYVCHFHLAQNLKSGLLESPYEVKQLREIAKFAEKSSSGDIDTCAAVPAKAMVWQLATSSKDNCVGTECEDYERCFLMKARRQAMNADVLVVNHHLFFADVALKKEGKSGELLPQANTIIFDEAHQVPEVASDYFGSRISSQQLIDLAHDVLRDGRTEAPQAADWLVDSEKLLQKIREWRVETANWQARQLRVELTERKDFEAFQLRSTELIQTLQQLQQTLEVALQGASSPPLAKILERVESAIVILNTWFVRDKAFIFWAESNPHNLILHQTPLSIREQMKTLREEYPSAWIFTSATLAVGKDFSYFSEKLGLEDASTKVLPSPFDYANQGLLYVPEIKSPIHSPQFSVELQTYIEPILEILKGRTMILCTSVKAVSAFAEQLRDWALTRSWPLQVLEQNKEGAAQLLQKFRNNQHAVLVASYAFWEGVDIPGEALQCVVIDKLPFVVPNDPVLVARIAYLEEQGKKGFWHYQVPEAIIGLKQGAGRLIRGEHDRGILLIGDSHLVDSGYGKQMWRSLPPFRRTRALETATHFAADLAAQHKI